MTALHDDPVEVMGLALEEAMCATPWLDNKLRASGSPGADVVHASIKEWIGEIHAALRDAGYEIVPSKVTATMLAGALPTWHGDPTTEDKRTAAAAIFMLDGDGGTATQDAVMVAAQLAMDYRLMVGVASLSSPTTEG